MRAFCRCRQKGVKKAEIKAEINRSALAGEPDPLERWLMALWVPLGLRKLGKDEFQISYFFPCKEFFHSMRAVILTFQDATVVCTVVTHRLGHCFADTDTHLSH